MQWYPPRGLPQCFGTLQAAVPLYLRKSSTFPSTAPLTLAPPLLLLRLCRCAPRRGSPRRKVSPQNYKEAQPLYLGVLTERQASPQCNEAKPVFAHYGISILAAMPLYLRKSSTFPSGRHNILAAPPPASVGNVCISLLVLFR